MRRLISVTHKSTLDKKQQTEREFVFCFDNTNSNKLLEQKLNYNSQGYISVIFPNYALVT